VTKTKQKKVGEKEMNGKGRQQEQQQQQPAAMQREEKRRKGWITAHQTITVLLLHSAIVLFQAYKIIPTIWLPILLYSLVLTGTIVLAIIKKEYLAILAPINFLSIACMNYFLEQTIAITAMYAVNLLVYVVLIFSFKDRWAFLGEMVSSAIAFLALSLSEKANTGFYPINHELHLVVVFLVLWAVIHASILYRMKEKREMPIVFSFTLMIMVITGEMARYLYVAEEYFDAYQLLCILLLGAGAGYTMALQIKEKEKIGLKIVNILPYIIGSFALSYSFPALFTWLTNKGYKVIMNDYLLFIPLVIGTGVMLMLHWREEERGRKEEREKERKVEYIHDKEKQKNDWLLVGIYALFILPALLMSLNERNYNAIRCLLVSILFLGIGVTKQQPAATTITIMTGMAFLAYMLNEWTGLKGTMNMIIMMSIATALVAMAIINEHMLAGEPITSALILAGSIMLMIGSVSYFYQTTIYLKYVLPGFVWAVIGLVNFGLGLMDDKLYMRRTGLSIILADIAYTIIAVILAKYTGWQIGITLMVLAVVLLGCILLFRWSERKEGKEEAEGATTAKAIQREKQ